MSDKRSFHLNITDTDVTASRQEYPYQTYKATKVTDTGLKRSLMLPGTLVLLTTGLTCA